MIYATAIVFRLDLSMNTNDTIKAHRFEQEPNTNYLRHSYSFPVRFAYEH